MLVIRLARTGRAKYPTYRIVAAESARAATGRFVAVLGHYNPHTKELVVHHEEVAKRLSQGAQPSNTVIKLLMREKMELPAWVKLQRKEVKKTDEPQVDVEEAAKNTVNSEAPAKVEAAAKEEVRIASVNEESASAAEANVTDIDHTDTAADEEKAAK